MMKEKLSLLTELIKLARTDKDCRDSEYDFLAVIAKMLGIDKTDFNKLFNEYIEYTPPQREVGRITQFHRMVLLSHVDFHCKSEELDHMRNAGLMLGLHPNAIEAVFEEMDKHENGAIPAENLIKIFQVYHN
jgi:Ca2+-binding EF-hand superfamily protein